MCVIHACQWPKEYAQACKILNIAWCSEAICSLLPSKEEYIIDTDVGNIDADDDKKIVAFYCKRPVSYTHLDVYKRQVVDCVVNYELFYYNN